MLYHPEISISLKLRQRCESRQLARGFTLTELLVGIAILAVFATVTTAVARQFIIRSEAAVCANNLRMIGLASIAYSQDNHSNLPASSHQRRMGRKSWSIDLQAYAGDALPMRCAQDPNPNRPYSYVINDILLPQPEGSTFPDFSKTLFIARPAATVLFVEVADDYSGGDHAHFANFRGAAIPWDAFSRQVAIDRHGGTANFLFVDGHVETLNATTVKARLAEPGTPFIDPSSQP